MRLPASHIRILFTYVFFRREISAVLSVFFCSGVIFGLFRQSVCCVLFSVFFWVFVCCFLIPVLYGSLFGDSGLFCGIFLMLAKMAECQCESVQNEGVSSVMPGIFGVIQ